jgi:hypothetical protein
VRTAEKLASSIGKGLVAGLAGTAAMTVSSTLEARLRHRRPSSAPARATAKVLGITSFADEIARAVQRSFALGLRHRLGNSARAARCRRPAAAGRDGGPRRRHMGQRAGDPARAGHRPAGHLLGTRGDRDRRLPPRGIRRRDGHRLSVAEQRARRTQRQQRKLTWRRTGCKSEAAADTNRGERNRPPAPHRHPDPAPPKDKAQRQRTATWAGARR